MSGTGSWTAVVPVKSLARAKSRMADAAAPTAADLALAFLQDTLAVLAAVEAVATIVVVTSDAEVSALAEDAGCTVVPDGDHPGINAAASWGASHAAAGSGVAVIVSDLPMLTPESLASVLRSAAHHRTSFLADAEGIGTTMWFAQSGVPVTTRFGEGSRAAHAADGAVDLVAAHPEESPAWTPARSDVDTLDALARALDAGVGPRTAAAVAPDARATRMLTVLARTDDVVRLVDEDGRVERLPWAALAAAGLRDVHAGQRLVAVGSGAAVSLRLPD